MAQPGIRQRFYLDGHSFTHWPDSFTPTPAFGESARRVRDGTLIDHTHRALVTDPDVSSKFRFELDWSRLSEADVAVWLRCAARRGPFLFCPWMEWREEFTFLAGESLAGNLQRGSAKDQIPTALLPATPAGDYDAKFYLNDTLSADFAIGAYANGRSAWATTTAATGPGVVSVVYAPIFTVRVVDQTLSLSSFRQGGKFVAEEY